MQEQAINKLKEIQNEYNHVCEQIADPNVMSDMNEYQKLAKKERKLQPMAEAFELWNKLTHDSKEAKIIIDGGATKGFDNDLIEMAELEIAELGPRIKKLEEEIDEMLAPKDERDDNNVIMEIRPAAGGDEAALFAGALLRMYNMYASSQGFKVEINDIDETEIGGVKSASLSIIGDGAFSKFKFESGVHRVQRVPDTETQGRIHTSTCTVAVLPEATTVDFKIEEKDLKVDTYRASGAGGQHVNKTESAIRITHLPTNTVVACQDGRSQIQNRLKAMLLLQTKLADHFQEQADKQYAQERRSQVGTGDRSERIRTYNYPQGRITDHRIGYTSHNLPTFMNGDIDDLVKALQVANRKV